VPPAAAPAWRAAARSGGGPPSSRILRRNGPGTLIQHDFAPRPGTDGRYAGDITYDRLGRLGLPGHRHRPVQRPRGRPALSDHMRTSLVKDALAMGLGRPGPGCTGPSSTTSRPGTTPAGSIPASATSAPPNTSQSTTTPPGRRHDQLKKPVCQSGSSPADDPAASAGSDGCLSGTGARHGRGG
jgi:hypothetical protein